MNTMYGKKTPTKPKETTPYKPREKSLNPAKIRNEMNSTPRHLKSSHGSPKKKAEAAEFALKKAYLN